MPIDLKKAILLGRTFEEYKMMFALTEKDLDSAILDCGGGPASFNYEMKRKGKKVISVDPIYEFTKKQIEQRINETFDDIIKQVEANKENFIWDNIKSIDKLKETRKQAMDSFISDYEPGLLEKRYQYGELPALEFVNNRFDLCLCSHFLFLYSHIFDLEFHIKSLEELLRVSKEIRIFPVVDLNARKSVHLEKTMQYFENKGLEATLVGTDYEFQKGGNEFLRIRA